MSSAASRVVVVTGIASGIGAATCTSAVARGDRVVGVDLHDADVCVDLATADGRAELAVRVDELTEGRIDAIFACAGVTAADLVVGVNYFGAVATLEGLRPLLTGSPAPRAVVVASAAKPRSTDRLGVR